VLVMTAGPGRVDSDNPIPLARPRDVSSPAFNDIRRQLTQKLTSQLARRPSPSGPGQGTEGTALPVA
jgi:ABC-type nitrate/sulfonate/bicarbonate transport system ATPase subunit